MLCAKITLPIVILTGPVAKAVLIACPSSKDSITTGIVTCAPKSPASIPGAPAPAALFIITTPIAPAFCALSALSPNWQVPLSIKAILPEMAAPFIGSVQPSLVGAVPSSTSTASAVQTPLKRLAPQGGVDVSPLPKTLEPAMLAGEFTITNCAVADIASANTKNSVEKILMMKIVLL